MFLFNIISSQFETRQLGRHAIGVLIESAERGSEVQVEYEEGGLVKYCLQSEWEFIEEYVRNHLPVRLLKTRKCTLVKYVTQTLVFDRLLQVIEMYSAYIRAHHGLIHLFQDATPDPDVFLHLHALLHEAREALKHLSRHFPRVFLVAQTTFTSRYMLKLKIEAVRTALSHGLLESSESETLVKILDSKLSELQVSNLNPRLAHLCLEGLVMESDIELFEV